MKLRTLEDLEKEYGQYTYEDSIVPADALKEEAIKWINSEILLGNENHISPEVKNWIKEFFNITDEDLK